MSYDSVLEHIGRLGRAQIFYLVLLGLAHFTPAVLNLLPVFIAAKRPYLCADKNSNLTTLSYCRRNNTYSMCPNNSWKFDDSHFKATIQSQYGLLCKRQFFVPLSTTIYMAGIFIGCTAYGILSDKVGRTKGLMIAGIHGLVNGILTPFSPTIIVFMVARFFLGIASGGVLSIANIVVVECVTPPHRMLWVMLFTNFWSLGIVVLTGIAYLETNHVYLQVIVSGFCIIPIICYFVLPMSPRWLLQQNRIDCAYKETLKIARWNRTTISRDKFNDLCKEGDGDGDAFLAKTKGNMFHMLQLKQMRWSTFAVWFNFMSASLVYYGLSLNSGDIGGNVYVNLLIMAIMEIPGRMGGVYFSDRFGRLPLLFIGFFVGGIFCLASAPIYKNPDYVVLLVAFSIIGKVFVGTSFDSMWLYSSEVYPTVVRNAAVGSASTAARLGGILAPQIILLEEYWVPSIFMVYGTLAVLAAGVTLTLPETRNMETLEVLDDGESFSRDNRLWKKRGNRKAEISTTTAKEREEQMVYSVI